MDEETKKLIAENYSLNKENNEMLKKMVFYQKLNQIYRVVYWSIIILSAIGAFYFLKPLLGSLISVYTGGVGVTDMGSVSEMSKSFGDKNQFQDLINLYSN